MVFTFICNIFPRPFEQMDYYLLSIAIWIIESFSLCLSRNVKIDFCLLRLLCTTHPFSQENSAPKQNISDSWHLDVRLTNWCVCLLMSHLKYKTWHFWILHICISKKVLIQFEVYCHPSCASRMTFGRKRNQVNFLVYFKHPNFLQDDANRVWVKITTCTTL